MTPPGDQPGGVMCVWAAGRRAAEKEAGYALARRRFEITKQEYGLALAPLVADGTGDLTLYECLQSFYQISPQERRARVTRNLTILKNYTLDLLGSASQ